MVYRVSCFQEGNVYLHSLTGWGQYLAQYLTLPVVNDAIAGRSARSYTVEGRFTTLINTVKSGDFVGNVICLLELYGS